MEQTYEFKANEFLKGMKLGFPQGMRRNKSVENKNIIDILREYYLKNYKMRLLIDIGCDPNNLIICNYNDECEVRIERSPMINEGNEDQNIKIKFSGDEIDKARFDLEYHLEGYYPYFKLK